MRNYNTYLKGMEKSNKEKLFFLNYINLNDFDKVIDFGCGKGDILKACDNGKIQLIGIDHDPVMINYAKENIPNAIFYNCLNRELITDKTLIIFSSVLHEIENYWKTLQNIINGTGATIVVRDMCYDGPNYKIIERNNLAKLIKYSNSNMLSDFIQKNDLRTIKDMYHYLLKYSYIDNWQEEIKENYFSFKWVDLLKMGTILYRYQYILEFKKNRVFEDFHIDLKYNTHIQLIIKLKKC